MSINTSIVLTVLGPDRPGLVERISSVVIHHQGNWLESHLAKVEGYFGGILHILVPTGSAEALAAELSALESEGLIIVQQSHVQTAEPEQRRTALLEVVGNDQPGIISRISHALAARGVNFDELDTECTSAPMSGAAIFRAKAKVFIPEGISLVGLRGDLERLAEDLLVEISVQ